MVENGSREGFLKVVLGNLDYVEANGDVKFLIKERP